MGENGGGGGGGGEGEGAEVCVCVCVFSSIREFVGYENQPSSSPRFLKKSPAAFLSLPSPWAPPEPASRSELRAPSFTINLLQVPCRFAAGPRTEEAEGDPHPRVEGTSAMRLFLLQTSMCCPVFRQAQP